MLSLLAEPTPQQLADYCRAYILELIGGVLMSNKSGNRVHMMYLSLLPNLDWAGWYNRGSACLTHLYREMCRVVYLTSKKRKDLYCCYSLGYGITCRSFNQGSSINCHIHLQIGKQ